MIFTSIQVFIRIAANAVNPKQGKLFELLSAALDRGHVFEALVAIFNSKPTGIIFILQAQLSPRAVNRVQTVALKKKARTILIKCNERQS